MGKSKWIWYYGDYEIFHSLLLHSRRQELGADYPAFFVQSHVMPTVSFFKTVDSERSGVFRVKANGLAYVTVNGNRYPTDTDVNIGIGKNIIFIRITNPRGLPAVYVSGDVQSDESWECDFGHPVGCVPEYTDESADVEVFPFEYQRMESVSVEKTEKGFLYDFGKETFGYLYIKGNGDMRVYYGESREEAMATDDPDIGKTALLFENVRVNGEVRLTQRAFRYIHILCDTQPDDVWMLYEYLPLKDVADFECDDPMVKKIFDVSAYTFHLNSREFYLDGIKRDRWVWSGDAYQSAMINRYLYNDPEIIKRTVIALLGKPPYIEHINTINDYTFYLMITVYDYWYASLDTEFVRRIYPRLYALYEFAVSRLDENGFVCKRDGDWIFVDWADLDKEGPMCAEQILLWQATKCMKRLAEAVGAECKCAPDSDALREKIYRFYYKKELGGFIDGYRSGKDIVNRQQNVLALLYDFTTPEESRLIMERVLCNPEIKSITTPYFEFFELLAMCKNGNVKYATDMLSSYWGGMLNLGATSVWEAFDPKMSGAQHYEMYGRSFGKSLCHAWGAGPVCILGKFVAGVSATSEGYKTFEVRPCEGIYSHFKATVPVGRGKVCVEYSGEGVRVFADTDGGKLLFGEKEYIIEKNRELFVAK